MNDGTDKMRSSTLEGDASDAFVRRLHGKWTRADQSVLETRLARDPAYADAYRRVEASWSSLDTHAESPQLMGFREEAIAYVRQQSAGRWLKSNRYARRPWRSAAWAAGVAVLMIGAWQLSPFGYAPGRYITGIGEQRMVELPDHSRIALDAVTRLQVHYSKDARLIVLKQGQAQFSVAKDPLRPFKVVVGGETIIALGTVFTVEYANQTIHVAMMEGRVAVVPEHMRLSGPDSVPQTLAESVHVRLASSKHAPTRANDQGATIELSAGEELRVARDGHSVVTPQADLEAAIAWREGKIIIRAEPIGQAVERLNRYSKVQIKITDEQLARKSISGVFEAGDTQGFVSALQRYLPVNADYSDSDDVRLSLR